MRKGRRKKREGEKERNGEVLTMAIYIQQMLKSIDLIILFSTNYLSKQYQITPGILIVQI